MTELQGTVAVIGAASGIGRGVTQLLLERDPKVTVVGLDLVAPGSPTTSDSYLGVAVDVTDPMSVENAFTEIASSAPPLTGLVCAAGILHREPSEQLPPEQWHRMLGVHLDGTFFACQQARHQMKAGASIVTFSSVAESFGWPQRAAYAAAKAGVSALTRSLAIEWAEAGIRVNCVAPGYVDTPLISAARERGDLHTDPADLHGMGRLARVEEIAAPVRFLLGDDASFITGETLFVDGGYRIFKGA